MGLISELARRVRMIGHRDQLGRDLDEEIKLHLELREQQLADRAGRSNVRWLVMRETLLLVATGIVIGIPITILSSHFVDSMLYGLHGSDPLSLIAAVSMLLTVAILAGYFPAQRHPRSIP